MDDFQAYANQYSTPHDATESAEPTFASGLAAMAGNTWEGSPLSSTARAWELEAQLQGTYYDYSGKRVIYDPDAGQEIITSAEAKSKAQQAGVTINFGEGDTTRDAADLLVERAIVRKKRDEVIAARDPYLITQLAVGVGVSALDPLNVAAAFIPVVPAARYTGMLAQASGFGGRAAVRAGVGAIEGVAGAALMEPLTAFAATQEGQDYSMADSLRNLAFGGIFGAGMHTTLGGVGEVVFKRRFQNDGVKTPVEAVDALPEAARETLLASTIADLVEGNPVKAGAVLDTIAQADPKVDDTLSVMKTLRRDGPNLDDLEARQAYWEARLKGTDTAGQTKPVDMRKWLTDIGGIIDRDGSFAAELGDARSELPRGALITARGLKQLQNPRGLEVDAVVSQAIDAGYAVSREDFMAKLKTGGRLVLTTVDREVAALRATEAAHTSAMREMAKVSPTTRHSFAARQIVAHEQRLVAEERARRAESASMVAGKTPEAPEPIAPVKAGDKPDVPAQAAQVETTLKALEGERAPVTQMTPEQYEAANAKALEREGKFIERFQGRDVDAMRATHRKFEAIRRLIDDLAPNNAEKNRYYFEQFKNKAGQFEIAERDLYKYLEEMRNANRLALLDEDTMKPIQTGPKGFVKRLNDENQPAVILRFKHGTGPRPPHDALLPFERDVIRDRQALASREAQAKQPKAAEGKPSPSGLEDETAARIAVIAEKLDDEGKAQLKADVMRLRDESSQAVRAFDVATLCKMGF